jgi:hypothetical protein
MMALSDPPSTLYGVYWTSSVCQSVDNKYSGDVGNIPTGQELQAASLKCPNGQTGTLACEYSDGSLTAIWRGERTIRGLPTKSTSICSKTGDHGKCCWPEPGLVTKYYDDAANCNGGTVGAKQLYIKSGVCQDFNVSFTSNYSKMFTCTNGEWTVTRLT